MLDKNTLRSHPSLFPLRAALTAAESGSPARPRRIDSNERLAMQLIARMQAGYRRTQPFVNPQETLESFPETAGIPA